MNKEGELDTGSSLSIDSELIGVYLHLSKIIDDTFETVSSLYLYRLAIV